ncbi:mechanosensitive ion channel family protein [Actinotalea sp. K2]|uniref:mechanosensitive ion channel family protein n=1 Tax=Actinotalea sp. K2 TaxID=2939438 RepID=UPI002017609E|nr:mechanosensitive ion channel domain-containing protein [Actinotalea sp. K2]MCL3863128.1 mechanosensitive ion channel [Actinotalea sp. K2]
MTPHLAARLAAVDDAESDIVLNEPVSAVVAVLVVAAALVVALVLAEVVAAVVRASGRRRPRLAKNLARRGRLPLRAVLMVCTVWVAVRLLGRSPVGEEFPAWRPAVEHLLLILLILSVAWLIGALAFVIEDSAMDRYRTDVPDNRHARRVRTQVMVLRRLTVAVLVVCAVAGVLLTFPGARAAGAGVLASAGLVSVVVGLAAQTSLANVFAGMQLAFTDAVRVDDVVVVDGEWGRIEEITMTYVVVHIWDDRRLILPSTYFTTTPFQNWTRRQADLLGTVEMDLDWAVPVAAMRAELTRVLSASDLWDHRVGVLQVTEAVNGAVRVRALASAVDAPTLFDLRCHVREQLVAWLQREHPEALPRTRLAQVAEHITPATPDDDQARAAAARRAAPPSQEDDVRTPFPEPSTTTTGEVVVEQDQEGRPAQADPDAAGAETPRTEAETPRTEAAAPRTGAEAPARSSDRPLAPEPDPTQRIPAQPAGPVAGPSGQHVATVVRRRRSTRQLADDTVLLDEGRDSRLFTGSIGAVERSKAFSGPGKDVIAERERTAEGLPATPGEDED